jgi:ferritin-like metal-binding protein YciE
MEHSALKELYIDELRDIYNAESQLVKALPKMAKASTSDELRSGFESHLEQTRGHVQRLEEIFDALDEKPTGKKCAGMQGLVKEGEGIMDEDFQGEVMDAALISAAQRVEHYEIAAYGCVRSWAELLGERLWKRKRRPIRSSPSFPRKSMLKQKARMKKARKRNNPRPARKPGVPELSANFRRILIEIPRL